MAQGDMIPSMTPERVHSYLWSIGREWQGRGTAMELGCWLGASSVPLLAGLIDAKYDLPFWAFDRWRIDTYQVKEAKKQGADLIPGASSKSLYLQNVLGIYENVRAIQGNLPKSLENYDGSPIEICVFDAPKKDPVFTLCMKYLEPLFVPGVTVLGLLDYYSYEKHTGRQAYNLLTPIRFMEKYDDCFTLIKHWPELCSCAFFKYEKPVDWDRSNSVSYGR